MIPKTEEESNKFEFELVSRAFSVMTAQEQVLVLILFKKSEIKSYIEAWIDSVRKVTKNLIK